MAQGFFVWIAYLFDKRDERDGGCLYYLVPIVPEVPVVPVVPTVPAGSEIFWKQAS